jgi:hypothetical protein
MNKPSFNGLLRVGPSDPRVPFYRSKSQCGVVERCILILKNTATGKTRLKNGRRGNKKSLSRMRGGHILY